MGSTSSPAAMQTQWIKTPPLPMQKPWIRTPLIESSVLSKAAGCKIFLKLENLQPSGSFKSRGIGNFVLQTTLQHPSEPLHFYISSGGNAGLAAVAAATSLGHKATVCVPTSTENATIAKLRAVGAEDVVQFGAAFADADKHLCETVIPEAQKKGERCFYIPPYDHPLVWEGASTMIEEIKDQMPSGTQPDAIVCSVGGGGLFSGLMLGLDKAGWSNPDTDTTSNSNPTRMIAVETIGAESLSQSLQKGELITLPGITSIATSLGAARVAEQCYKQALRPHVTSLVIEDAEACASAWRFADDERILVEPACGAAVALAYDGRLGKHVKDFNEETKVVLVVCGGSRISLALMEDYRRRFGARAKELGLSRCGDVPSTFTS